MLEKLALVEERYEELNRLMSDPEIATDPDKMREYAQEQSDLENLVQKYRKYKQLGEELIGAEEIYEQSEDEEMRELAEEEIATLREQQEKLIEQMRLMLLPKDPRDQRDVIIEIRAGAGGDEAGLFAADLYRIYTRYAENQGWKTEMLDFNDTGIGGFKQVIFEVRGKGVYSKLKYESGVHRVQRVPDTESSGRIHTSTATVAVLPEADEVEVEINPNELKIDSYCSSGPGGQHMQKNETAIRITHIPTGLVVSCESQRSQLQNKIRALAILRARMLAIEEEKQRNELDAARRSQVGTGDRSEKIRTYNFPQSRVTDHRIHYSSHRLDAILSGEIDEFIEALTAEDQARKLEELGEGG